MAAHHANKDDHTVAIILITAAVVAFLLWLLWGNNQAATPAASTSSGPDYPALTAPDITSPMYSVAPASAGSNGAGSVPLPPWANSADSVTPSCGCAAPDANNYYGSVADQAPSLTPAATAGSVAITEIINNNGDDTPDTSPLQTGSDNLDPVVRFLQSYNPSSFNG